MVGWITSETVPWFVHCSWYLQPTTCCSQLVPIRDHHHSSDDGLLSTPWTHSQQWTRWSGGQESRRRIGWTTILVHRLTRVSNPETNLVTAPWPHQRDNDHCPITFNVQLWENKAYQSRSTIQLSSRTEQRVLCLAMQSGLHSARQEDLGLAGDNWHLLNRSRIPGNGKMHMKWGFCEWRHGHFPFTQRQSSCSSVQLKTRHLSFYDETNWRSRPI